MLGLVLRVEIGRQVHVLLGRPTLQLLAGLAMVIDHSLAELLHVRIGRLARGEFAEIDLGHSTDRGLLHKSLIGGGQTSGGRRVLLRRWLWLGSFRLCRLRLGGRLC
jgi:hypothetical protein